MVCYQNHLRFFHFFLRRGFPLLDPTIASFLTSALLPKPSSPFVLIFINPSFLKLGTDREASLTPDLAVRLVKALLSGFACLYGNEPIDRGLEQTALIVGRFAFCARFLWRLGWSFSRLG